MKILDIKGETHEYSVFLTPKSDVAFIYSDANLREAIDLMEAHRYSALPILTKQGRVCRNADGIGICSGT